MTADSEPFLSRWSRRKLEARSGSSEREADASSPAPAAADEPPAAGEAALREGPGRAEAAPAQPRPAPDFRDFDFSTLDRNSDYKQFVSAGVPDEVRSKALSRLWLSDPTVGSPQELHDYLDDFTDAARVPKGLVETAYKIGQGFLSDAEAAEWERLGRPEMTASAAAVTVAQESPDQPEIRAMLAASDEYAQSLYPAESNHLVGLSVLAGPGSTFLVARHGKAALGCVALIEQGDDWGEIKRMWVVPAARGRGIGRRLIEAVEARARDRGLKVLRLETGIRQDPAIRLYERHGFARREPFGAYQPDPLSLFMEKRLA